MYTVPGTIDHLVGTAIRNYNITQLLGQGSLSVVYLAEQYPQRQPVMLTLFMLSPTYDDQAREQFFARFSQISSGLVHLNHPSILPTLDFGEYTGFPFLVTPYVEEISLASVLRQQGRCTPEQTLSLLRQVAAALDHAHEQGVIHGTLRSANVLLASEQTVHMTGFGLAQMLGMRGIGNVRLPQAHLLNIGGSFLYSPEYLAPEVIQGAALSALTDIYALGNLMFELLTGRTPFSGSEPFAVAAQHLTQRLPSLLELCPDLPAGLDLVVQRALERNPAERYQSASKLVAAFSRVLGVLEAAMKPLPTGSSSRSRDILGATLPPISDWFYSEAESIQSSQDASVAQRLPLAPPPGWRAQPSSPMTTTNNTSRQPTAPRVQATDSAFNDWQPSSGAQPAQPPVSPLETVSETRLRSPRKRVSRRTVLVAASGVVVVGVGAISLPRLLSLGASAPKASTPKPGTTIGATKQALNSAQTFTNPADKQESLLIHLPDKSFAAYKSACTHENVTVRYDAATHMLVCPKHGSIFDPAKKGAVVKGPATKPLPSVQIRVNNDGSITTG